MLITIKAVYNKNRAIVKRAYPTSFIVQRIIGGIGAILFPILIYLYIFQSTTKHDFYQFTGTMDYITYVTIGVATNILSFSTLMNVGRCIISEIREGTLDTFLLSPASRIGYFIGAYLEQFVRSSFEFLVVLCVGAIFGANLSINSTFFIVLIISSLAFFSVSIVLSSIMVMSRDTYLSQNTLVTLMSLLCGISFPPEYLPYTIKNISSIFPLTYAVSLIRKCLINNESLSLNLIILSKLIISSVIFLFVGYFLYRKCEKELIENIYS